MKAAKDQLPLPSERRERAYSIKMSTREGDVWAVHISITIDLVKGPPFCKDSSSIFSISAGNYSFEMSCIDKYFYFSKLNHPFLKTHPVIDHLWSTLLLGRYLSGVEIPLCLRLMADDVAVFKLGFFLFLGFNFRLLLLVFFVGMAVEQLCFLLLFFDEFLVK